MATIVAAAAISGTLVACSGTNQLEPATLSSGNEIEILEPGSPDDMVVQLSQQLLNSADAVVISPSVDDEAALEIAAELNLPLLPDTVAGAEEIDRLGPETIIALTEPTVVTDATVYESLEAITDEHSPAEPDDGASAANILWPAGVSSAGAEQFAAHVGAEFLELPEGDPRSISPADNPLAGVEDPWVIAFTAEDLSYELDVLVNDIQLPWGGYEQFGDRHYVALYGHPQTPALGLLGEQDAAGSVDRVNELVAEYEDISGAEIVPMFEIIATIASASAGPDGDYSSKTPISELRPLVDEAAANNVSVVLDLQPGRTDFLTQAKLYEELLLEPHVGLALDPEWRLEPNQVHLTQIGSVDAAEINEVSDWLAELTRENSLPQKMLVLHQFQPRMISNRETLDTSHPELATLIHVDGQGPPAAKIGTWNLIRQNAPENVAWGWKNFIDEDEPMLTPQQTWDQVSPLPELITYQ